MSIKRPWQKYRFLINVVAPIKTVRIKNNTRGWLDRKNCGGDSQAG